MQARIRIHRDLWEDLVRELHRRTEGCHESGAFLLGRRDGCDRVVKDIVYYDDLDPAACQARCCTLRSNAFTRLWEHCSESALSVVADAHVHLRDAYQSELDRTNPMIAIPGHIALIFPNLARSPVRIDSLAVFVYSGSHRWQSLGGVKGIDWLRLEEKK